MIPKIDLDVAASAAAGILALALLVALAQKFDIPVLGDGKPFIFDF